MNILIVGTTDNVGGASRVGWDLGKELQKLGHTVNFLVGRKNSEEKNVNQIAKNNISSFVKKKSGKDIDLYFRQTRDFVFSDDISFGESDTILNHPWYKKADIVHLQNLHGNFFKLNTLEKISKSKIVIWTLHDMWSFTGHCAHSFDCKKYQKGCGNCPYLSTYFPFLRDSTNAILRKKKTIYNRSNFEIVCPSNWLKKIVKTSILKNKITHLIYNGIDTKIFTLKDKYNSRKDLGLPLDKKIVLTVGQGGKRNIFKGSEYFEKISNKNPEILFVNVGSSDRDNCNVINTGYISQTNILSKYYSSADVFLFPSLAENCPLAVLEAMSCGLPTLAFNVGGIPELITHKVNGYIARYKDLADLNKGLNYLLNLSSHAKSTMQKVNVHRAKEYYSIKTMADKYLKLYKTIESKKP